MLETSRKAKFIIAVLALTITAVLVSSATFAAGAWLDFGLRINWKVWGRYLRAISYILPTMMIAIAAVVTHRRRKAPGE
jgi:hypothetical protein